MTLIKGVGACPAELRGDFLRMTRPRMSLHHQSLCGLCVFARLIFFFRLNHVQPAVAGCVVLLG